MNRAEQETRARVFLNRLGRIARRLKLKREQVQALHELATSATAQISDMPRSDSPNLQRLETLVCRIADLDAEIQQESVEMEAVRLETALMICRLHDPIYQRILTLRYIDNRKWNEIMDELGYSRSRIFEMHEDALCAMEKLLAESGGEHELY